MHTCWAFWRINIMRLLMLGDTTYDSSTDRLFICRVMTRTGDTRRESDLGILGSLGSRNGHAWRAILVKRKTTVDSATQSMN